MSADLGPIAAIDIGTNSVHMVVARPRLDRFDVLAREKEVVRLGSGGGDMKQLAPDAIDRGVAALLQMRKVAEIFGAPVRAVATSAVREAENRDEFLIRAREEAGVDVEVISGVEEARLIHLGVLQAVPVFDRRALLIDIGGGSTEIVIGDHGELLLARSLKLGAIRLTERFFKHNRLHPGAVQGCRQFIRSTLAPVAVEVAPLGFEVAVGSSGTIAALAAMVRGQRGEPEPVTTNNFTFGLDELRAVVARIVAADTVARRRRLPGLDPARADIILAGALICEEVATGLGAERITYSDYALREGVLLDTIERRRGGALHHLRDLSRRSVHHLMETCDENVEHSRAVARLALRLFDETAPLHGLDESAREYLEAGALLANVGQFISHSRHHLHSYYVIRNSEQLTGFTDREIEIIALIARYHRKSAPKKSHEPFARLWPEDQHLVRVLAALLRVAIGLDRTYRQAVTDLTCHDDGTTLAIEIDAAPGVDTSLELYAAQSRRGLLEQVLRRAVEIRPALART